MDDRALEGCAYGNLGRASQPLGDLEQAINYHEQERSIAKEVGDRKAKGQACSCLCDCYHRLEKFRTAMEFHKQHLSSIAKEVGDRCAQGCAYLNIAEIHRSLGDLKRSKEYCLEYLRIAEETGYKRGKGKAYCCLRITFLRQRNFKHATKYLKLHLDVAKEIRESSESSDKIIIRESSDLERVERTRGKIAL